jgi:FixJ family two-component response regulator
MTIRFNSIKGKLPYEVPGFGDLLVADALTRALELQEEARRDAEKRQQLYAGLKSVWDAGARKKILSFREFCVLFLGGMVRMEDKEIAGFLKTSVGYVQKARSTGMKKLKALAAS